MYTTETATDFPHQVVAIIVTLSLSENRESSESQRNKDVFTVLQCMTICWHHTHLSLSPVSDSIRLRLTIMCDANKMCGKDKISTHSQIGLL